MPDASRTPTKTLEPAADSETTIDDIPVFGSIMSVGLPLSSPCAHAGRTPSTAKRPNPAHPKTRCLVNAGRFMVYCLREDKSPSAASSTATTRVMTIVHPKIRSHFLPRRPVSRSKLVIILLRKRHHGEDRNDAPISVSLRFLSLATRNWKPYDPLLWRSSPSKRPLKPATAI